MYKGIILTVESSFSWLNLLESSIGSLVGALVGTILGAVAAYLIGNKHIEKQINHNEDLFRKEVDIIEQNSSEEKYFNLQVKELEHQRENLMKLIDRTYSHMDMLQTLQTEYTLAINKKTPFIYNGNILRGLTKIAEYTVNYEEVELKEDANKLKEEDELKEETLDEVINLTISKIVSEDVELTTFINQRDTSISKGDTKPNYLSIIDHMFTELEYLLTHLYKKSNNIDEEIARKKNQMKSRIEQGVQKSSETTIQ